MRRPDIRAEVVSVTSLRAHTGSAFRLAVAASVCYVAAFALLSRLQVGGERGSLILSDVALTIPPLLGAAGCFWASRRVKGRTRLAWLLVGTGSAAYAVGSAIWFYYEVVLSSEVPFPSLADPFYLSIFPLAIAGLLVFPSAPVSVASRFRSVFDALIVAGSLFFLAWTLVLKVVFGASEGSLFSQALGLAYPIGDVVVCILVLVVAVRVRQDRRLPFGLLALGLTAYALTDFGFAYLSSQGLYVSGHIIDSGWTAAGLLMMLAGLAQGRHGVEETDDQPAPRMWLRTVLPYLVLLPAFALGVAQALAGNYPDAVGWVIAVVLIVLLVARQFLTLHENVTLTRALRTTVNDLRTAESDMRHQAFHDALTGLANRALFRDRITHAAAVAQRQPWEIAVLFLDLDDFKLINDTLGHEAGDVLLVDVAARLTACIRAADTAARMGGDEFAVLLEDGGRIEALRVAQRISKELDRPFHLNGRDVTVRTSIGIAVPKVAMHADPEELLRHADIAMYSSKSAGKGRATLYEEAMSQDVGDRLSLRTDMTRGLLNDEFAVYFQPVVELSTGRVISVEALARWHHPQRGLLAAQSFIGLAVESGLVVPLGQQILNLTCAAIAGWRRQHPGQDFPPVSVNLCGRQLADPAMVDDISAALLEHGLEASSLILEITETTLMSDTEAVVAPLRALKALGVALAIDNFGTGHSSLANLDQFPIEMLKIDRGFVAGMSEAARDDRRGLVAAVLRLGTMLDLQTIATGVEQPWQIGQLWRMGCTAVQGHFLCPPQPAAAMSRLLQSHDFVGSGLVTHRGTADSSAPPQQRAVSADH